MTSILGGDGEAAERPRPRPSAALPPVTTEPPRAARPPRDRSVPWLPSRLTAFALVLVAIAALVIGALLYHQYGQAKSRVTGQAKDAHIVCIELGGSNDAPRYLPTGRELMLPSGHPRPLSSGKIPPKPKQLVLPYTVMPADLSPEEQDRWKAARARGDRSMTGWRW